MIRHSAATSLSHRDGHGTGAKLKRRLVGGMAFLALVAGGTNSLADGVAPPTAKVPVKAVKMPVKAPPKAPADGWTGFYVGGHFGIAAGSADWRANGFGAPLPPVGGSINLFNSFDAFRGTGSFFGGFQAGYNYLLPSGLLLGIESDISFGNTIGGTGIIAAPSIGQASFADTVQTFGTLRARVGMVRDHWLYYATGGFAWSYDELIRTQDVGTPVGGSASPGTDEHAFKIRTGWAAGAGVEIPIVPRWTAKLEYLYAGFGNHAAVFPAGAQRIESDLSLHTVRAGLNYRLDASGGGELKLPEGIDQDNWSIHGQTTYVHQYAPSFRSPYRGKNSLIPNQGRETWDFTVYAGFRLWQGAELWVNPEIDQGFGLSSTLGVAGFTSGEAYKVGASVPYVRVPRYFIRQTIDLGGDTEKVERDVNQFAGSRTANRLVLTVGKFSVSDIFDTLSYAHDPRNDFMNWALIDAGTFDYAADAWGYTYGATIEWYQGAWALRGGLFDLSIVPNNEKLDPTFQQFQWVGEIEHRHELWGQPGKVMLTGFLTRGRMGRFSDAIQQALLTGEPADIAAVRQYRSRSGLSIGVEQQVMPNVGVFARAGVASGGVEPYEFTDVDRTVAGGVSLSGKLWGRDSDTVGIAGIVNGISGVHQAFFNAGGLGILVGDGKLPNPGTEKIMEMYYSFPVWALKMTLDYQLVVNPGYNRDRGPASILGTRLRAQF
jgi:high affinity Mn2+ porin